MHYWLISDDARIDLHSISNQFFKESRCRVHLKDKTLAEVAHLMSAAASILEQVINPAAPKMNTFEKYGEQNMITHPREKYYMVGIVHILRDSQRLTLVGQR